MASKLRFHLVESRLAGAPAHRDQLEQLLKAPDGYWKAQTLRRHPRSLRPRQIAAPALVASLLGGALAAAAIPFAVAPAAPPWLAGALIAIYGLATLLAAAASLPAHGARVAARLPAVFATMHVAWGLGFWWGWLRPPRARSEAPAAPRE